MRSLKDCYEIVKQYHMYWNHNADECFMCVAADYAALNDALSKTEVALIKQDAMSLVKALDQSSYSLRHALRDDHKDSLPNHDTVKAFWDNYLNSLE